jgi:hypothetical protein
MSFIDRLALVLGIWAIASVLIVLVWGAFLTKHERREMIRTLKWLHEKDTILSSAMRSKR